jgi:hypothetical protein
VQVWDHVLTNPPAFLPHVALAYLLTSRRALLAAPSLGRCRALAARPPSLDANKLLRRAYHLVAATPDCLQPLDQPFVPLPAAGAYPPFRRFPARALDAQRAERARVRDEEAAVRDRARTLATLEARL